MKHDYDNFIDELMTDENLIHEVLNGQLDKSKWLLMLREKNIPESVFLKAVEGIKALNGAFDLGSMDEQRKTALFEGIERQIHPSDAPETISVIRKIRPWLVAASVILCLGISYVLFFQTQDAQVRTLLASSERVELNDGSWVHVSPESEVSWNKRSFENNRVVKLEGEAFFEVTKGEKFTVSSRWGDVEVLGTSFNIWDRANRYEVVCRSGKVSVTLDNGKQFILTAGMKLNFDPEKDEAVVDERSSKEEVLWVDGNKFLEDATVSELQEELKRYFAIDLEVPDEFIQRRGNFLMNTNNLDSSLYQVSWPLNAQVEKVSKNHYRLVENR